MAFTPDGIAPPGIPLLGCSPPQHYEVQNGLGGLGGIQYTNVQQILVVAFEFTGAARGFMIMSYAARGVKKVGQHCLRAYNYH